MDDNAPAQPPTDHHHPAPRRHVSSLVMVNTGHGKGKSTAAFGLLLRAIARDWRCTVVQFVKSGNWQVGEETVCRRLGVDWWTIGDGFTWDSNDHDGSAAVAVEAWDAAAERLTSGTWDVVVLDEITYPINWGWIDTTDVIAAIQDRADTTSVVCTGRDAPDALIDVADTVTEMRNVKHAYQRGVRARRGIDY